MASTASSSSGNICDGTMEQLVRTQTEENLWTVIRNRTILIYLTLE